MKHTGIYKTRQFSLLHIEYKNQNNGSLVVFRIAYILGNHILCMLKKGIQMQIHTKASKQHFAFEVIYNICGVF